MLLLLQLIGSSLSGKLARPLTQDWVSFPPLPSGDLNFAKFLSKLCPFVVSHLRTMKDHVFGLVIQKLKVFRRVILLVSINMMDYFKVGKGSPELFCHDDSVKGDLSPVSRDKEVSVFDRPLSGFTWLRRFKRNPVSPSLVVEEAHLSLEARDLGTTFDDAGHSSFILPDLRRIASLFRFFSA